MKAPKIDVDAGGAWLLPWAKQQLARFKRLLNFGIRRFDLPTGETVRIQWGLLDKIRITSALDFLRAWDPAGGTTLSIKARLSGEVLESKDAEPADWSKRFDTFARASGGNVEVGRGATTLTPADTAPFAPNASTSFYRTTNAVLAASGGKTLLGVDDKTASRIAVLVEWDGEALAATDIPYPPITSAGSSTADFPAGGYVMSAVSNSGPVLFGAALVCRLYACATNLRYLHAIVSSGGLVSQTPLLTYAGGTAWQLQVAYSLEHWRYDLTTRTWEQVSVIDSLTASLALGDPSVGSGGSGVSPSGLHGELAVRSAEVVFDSEGAAHLLTWDAREPLDGTTNITVFGNMPAEPFSTVVPIPTTSYTWAEAVDVYLDGALWFSNIGVSPTAALGVIGDVSAGVINTLHLGLAGRGAITASYSSGSGRYGTFWNYASGEWTQTAVETVKLSRSGQWMYRGTDHRLVYKDGVQVYDGADDALIIYLPSTVTDGHVLAHSEITTILDPVLTTFYTGTVTFIFPPPPPPMPPLPPVVLDVTEGSGYGLSSDGSILYNITEGTSTSTTGLIVVLDGGSFTALFGGGETTVDRFGSHSFSETYDLELEYSVPLAYVLDSTTYTFSEAKIVPGEYVP